MPLDIDMVVQTGAALLPFRIDVWLMGQRLQRGLIQRLEQSSAAGTKMSRDLLVQLIAQGPDRCIHLIKAEECLVTQTRQYPTFSQ